MNVMTLQLKALRAACVAVVASIDLYLDLATSEETPHPTEPQPLSQHDDKVFNPDAAKCQHPRSHWVTAPAMGNPGRILCRCGEEMEEASS